MGLAARGFGEVVVTSILRRTPINVTILIMIVITAIAARNDAGVIARILTFYMPFVYVPALFGFFLLIGKTKATNVMPLLDINGEGHGYWGLFHSVIFVLALFQNYIIIYVPAPFMHKPSQVWKSNLIGVGITGVYTIGVICYGDRRIWCRGSTKLVLANFGIGQNSIYESILPRTIRCDHHLSLGHSCIYWVTGYLLCGTLRAVACLETKKPESPIYSCGSTYLYGGHTTAEHDVSLPYH